MAKKDTVRHNTHWGGQLCEAWEQMPIDIVTTNPKQFFQGRYNSLVNKPSSSPVPRMMYSVIMIWGKNVAVGLLWGLCLLPIDTPVGLLWWPVKIASYSQHHILARLLLRSKGNVSKWKRSDNIGLICRELRARDLSQRIPCLST